MAIIAAPPLLFLAAAMLAAIFIPHGAFKDCPPWTKNLVFGAFWFGAGAWFIVVAQTRAKVMPPED